MTLLELFQSDTRMQGILTKIMTQRIRMRYKRDQVRATVRAYTSQVDTITMGEVEALHWLVNPQDAPRVPKQNMTRPRKDRTK